MKYHKNEKIKYQSIKVKTFTSEYVNKDSYRFKSQDERINYCIPITNSKKQLLQKRDQESELDYKIPIEFIKDKLKG